MEEDTNRATARHLTKGGHDVELVVDVPELGTGSEDQAVLAYANSSNRIIVTHDRISSIQI